MHWVRLAASRAACTAAFGKNEKSVLSASLAYDRWHGRDSNNGEGIEDVLGLAISIGRRF